MSAFAIGLVLASCLFHAGWNVLVRSRRNERAFLRRALLLVAVAGFPLAIGSTLAMPSSFSNRVVMLAAASGVAIGIYFFALARAYASGEFTVVYPVGRALPIVLVAIGDVARGRTASAWGWAGMALVVGACIVIPLTSLRKLSIRRYASRNMAWVLLTALGVAAFTMIDKVAQEAAPAGPLSAIVYNYMIYAIAACLNVVLGRSTPEEAASVGWWRPALAAVFTFTSYSLVLWALQHARHAAYVVAFRQVSILIGVVIGLVWFRERGGWLRLGAAGLMVGGLVLIKLAG